MRDENRPDAAAQVQDPSSLYSCVKKLIAFRQAHSALGSTAEIEFVSDGYPLVYRRKAKNESILVDIQPSSRPAEIKAAGEVICSIGKGGFLSDGTLSLSGESAVFILEE